MRNEVECDRRQYRAPPSGIIENLGAAFRRIHHPLLEFYGCLLVDDRAEIGIGIHRIAEFDLPSLVNRQGCEFICQFFHD
jgi:hypothetical protein